MVLPWFFCLSSPSLRVILFSGSNSARDNFALDGTKHIHPFLWLVGSLKSIQLAWTWHIHIDIAQLKMCFSSNISIINFTAIPYKITLSQFEPALHSNTMVAGECSLCRMICKSLNNVCPRSPPRPPPSLHGHFDLDLNTTTQPISPLSSMDICKIFWDSATMDYHSCWGL